jgi:hypothetical protein
MLVKMETGASGGGGGALKNINDWVVADTAKTGSTTVTFTLQPNLKNKIYALKSDSGSTAFNSYAIGDNASALFINKASDALLFIDENGDSFYQTTNANFQPHDGTTIPTYNKTTGLVSCTQRAATYATIIVEVM